MNFLNHIVERKVEEVASRKRRRPAGDFTSSPHFGRTPVPLSRALASRDRFHVIAEVKKASPTAGIIAQYFSPAELASSYARSGASAISVLTDEEFFSGSLRHLEEIRAISPLPLLRKDFIIDEYQIGEARAAGADAILLIATILDRQQMRDLHAAARAHGLDALVELYDAKDAEIVDFDMMRIIGINNRDLRTFKVDLSRSRTIAKLIPEGVTIVSESGIHTPDDCIALRENGIHAALIGEALMRTENPGAALASLLNGIHHATTH